MAAKPQPAAILKELNEFWESLAPASSGGEGVLRACSLTLIATTRRPEDAPALKQTIAGLMRDHPSRAILVYLRPAPQPLEAHVSAECWLPFGQRRQLCCEQIEITAPAAEAAELAPFVSALAAPDLPVVVWCRDCPLIELSGYGELAAIADKLIVDSANHPDPASVVERIASAGERPIIADLSWTRITGWREAVAERFRTSIQAMMPFDAITVTYAGDHIPPSSLYLAAWLVSALKVDAAPVFRSGASESVVLSGPGGSFEAPGPPPRPETDLLREEIGITGRDPVYDTVRRQAAGIARRHRR